MGRNGSDYQMPCVGCTREFADSSRSEIAIVFVRGFWAVWVRVDWERAGVLTLLSEERRGGWVVAKDKDGATVRCVIAAKF